MASRPGPAGSGAGTPKSGTSMPPPAQVAVLQQTLPVLRGVDRVVRLIRAHGEPRELPHDYGLAGCVFALRVEVTELVNARVGDVRVGVVHDRRALEVAGRHDLSLKVERAPTELSLCVLEVLVDRPGVDNRDKIGKA